MFHNIFVQTSIRIVGGTFIGSYFWGISCDSQLNKQNFIKKFQKKLPSIQIDVAGEDICDLSNPPNSYHTSPYLPFAIVSPRSTIEVSEVMKIAFQHDIKIVPFGNFLLSGFVC